MIDTVSIKNFQSHKNTYLELDSGVNVILGNTDSGKSAVLRALRWLANNMPAGADFRSHWAQDDACVVSAALSEGTDISRTRAKSINSYEIDGEELRGFNQTVPPEVADALNLSEINWQFQMDEPFLINESPAAAARMLNKIADLDVIDKSLSSINSKARQLNSEIKLREGDYKEAREDLEEFKGLDELDGMLVALESRNQDLRAMKRKIDSLGKLLDEFHESQILLLQFKGLTKVKKKFRTLEARQKELLKVQDKIRFLERLLEDIEANQEELKEVAAEWEASVEEFAEMMPDRCPLCDQEIKK